MIPLGGAGAGAVIPLAAGAPFGGGGGGGRGGGRGRGGRGGRGGGRGGGAVGGGPRQYFDLDAPRNMRDFLDYSDL